MNAAVIGLDTVLIILLSTSFTALTSLRLLSLNTSAMLVVKSLYTWTYVVYFYTPIDFLMNYLQTRGMLDHY